MSDFYLMVAALLVAISILSYILLSRIKKRKIPPPTIIHDDDVYEDKNLLNTLIDAEIAQGSELK